MRRKAQTSMMLIVVAIVIFMGIGIFMLISSVKPQYDEYNNLYVHNLLLSVLRRNTGYTGECETVSSVLTCAVTIQSTQCNGIPCNEVADQIVPDLVGSVIKPTFDYCLVIEQENWEVVGGERITYGPRCDVVMSKNRRWTANEKVLQYGSNIDIQMIIAEA